jgi:hypothetical protein
VKKLVIAALVAGSSLAVPAAAAPILNYQLQVTGNNSGSSADTPTFLLTNTSTFTGSPTGADAMAAYLTSLSLTFNGTSYVDRLTNFTTPTPPTQTAPPIVYDVVNPDGSSNNVGTQGFLINFDGFNAGDAFRFAADFDVAGGGNANYRSILEGATIGVTFANGATSNLTLSGFNANTNSYTFAGENVSAVPEPATWGMMLLGFGALGGTMRYRRKKGAAAFA